MEIPTVSPVVVDALSDATRRAALAALVESGATVTIGELAEALAQRSARWEPDTGTDRTDLRTALHHAHLPALADAGGITFDPESGLVAVPSETPFDREWAARLVADHPETSYDRVLDALASGRRQLVVHRLLTGGPADDRELAVAVAAHERGVAPGEVPASVAEVVELSLTHTHLPALADAGFIARTDEGTVAPEPMPWRSDPWVAASPIGEWAAAE